MKKLTLFLMFVLSMAMASHRVLAQEVVITLNPGWTWVSYPRADTLTILEGLGSFTPTNGDVIKSQAGYVSYLEGYGWYGSFTHFIPGKGLMYRSMNPNVVSFVFGTSSEEDDWVDLGLPSGLLWATCNVGADTPEDYGDYFAWGETSLKSVYNWSTYQYTCNNNYDGLTKYCNSSSNGCNGYTDNLTILQHGDDAATANYGGRMPTKEEWQELRDNCTSVWTTLNGVNGRLFTGPNGNTLFLPAAGGRWGSELYNASYRGYYWSSSLGTYDPYHAWGFYFYSSDALMSYYDRNAGLSVRAVRSAYQVITLAVTNITPTTATGGGTITCTEGCVVTERGICWSTNHNPTIYSSHASSGTSTGNYTVNMTGLTAGTTYYVRAYAVVDTEILYGNEVSFTATGDWVDLGLPSGLLWATCNVGASSPEDYGDYFAWGETSPKSVYDWDTYQYTCNNDYDGLTKYCNNSWFGCNGYTDNLTILQFGDDAATANYGGRMPTNEDWEELRNNCTSVWMTLNGVNGQLFIGSNGNTLFLPAAGYRWDSELYAPGSTGAYWSSSLGTGSGAWYFGFSSGYDNTAINNRDCGQSVRAVREN